MSPIRGTPFPDTILNVDGNSLSLAAAIGNCPWSRIHPFRAPKQDIAAPIAIRPEAQSPQTNCAPRLIVPHLQRERPKAAGQPVQ
jgi:hypothetical protein